MLLEKKNFPDFQVFDFSLHPKWKTWKSRKVFFYFKFWRFCNLRFRNNKNELRQKIKVWYMLLEEKKQISEVSEFSILPYTQNWKLRNLGKCSFTLICDSCCNLSSRNNKNELRQKPKGQVMFLEGKKKLSKVSEFSILL